MTGTSGGGLRTSSKLADALDRDGFVILPQVFSKQEIQGMRQALLPRFKLADGAKYKGDTDQYLFDCFS